MSEVTLIGRKVEGHTLSGGKKVEGTIVHVFTDERKERMMSSLFLLVEDGEGFLHAVPAIASGTRLYPCDG